MSESSSLGKSPHTITQAPQPVNGGIRSIKTQLVEAAGLVGLMTLASRVLGLIRDIVSAGHFGTSWQWDAFIYAFMLPNFFRRLVGEGALSSAFIPVYSEILQQKGKDHAFRFANVTGSALAGGLAVLVGAIGFALNALLAMDFLPRSLHLTVDLLRFFFPYLWFMSLFALGMGVLNCHRHFFAPSLGPVILDILWIAGVLWVAPLAGSVPENQLRALALVLLISGAIQVSTEIPPLLKAGIRLRWVWDPADLALRKMVRLLLPTVLGFAVVQINMLVDMTLGLALGTGAASSLWYGTRLMQFPLGIFTIAMGTALLPALSHQAARQELEAARKTLSFALRSVFLIILPCTVGLILLRVPIVRLLFERGEFDAVSTARTAAVLMGYAIGLFAYSGEKLMTAGFYASQDTRTPVKLAVVSLVANIILNLILMQFFAEAGLALATSLASMAEFSLLVFFYHRRIADFPFREVGLSFAKIGGASLAMGVTCLAAFGFFERAFPGHALKSQLIAVFGTISVAAAAYAGFCFLFRVAEVKEAAAWLLGKRNHEKG